MFKRLLKCVYTSPQLRQMQKELILLFSTYHDWRILSTAVVDSVNPRGSTSGAGVSSAMFDTDVYSFLKAANYGC